LGDSQEDQEPQNTMPTGGQMTKMVQKEMTLGLACLLVGPFGSAQIGMRMLTI
jgi:hypothetical protein